MDLRDKYITASLQRLGDNPRDHDGVFFGFKDNAGDVSGIKPDASAASTCTTSEDSLPVWRIYPRPPPPHWHYKDLRHSSATGDSDEEFDFTKCPIPEIHPWEFKLDEKGVFQVYSDPQTDSKGNHDVLEISGFCPDYAHMIQVLALGSLFLSSPPSASIF